MTLMEVMAAMGLFAMVAVGLYASFIQSAKTAKLNYANTAAHNLAKSVCNQMAAAHYSGLKGAQTIVYQYFDKNEGIMKGQTLRLGAGNSVNVDVDLISRNRVDNASADATGRWAWQHQGETIATKTRRILQNGRYVWITDYSGGTSIGSRQFVVIPEVIEPSMQNATKDPMSYLIARVTVQAPAETQGQTPVSVEMSSLVSRIDSTADIRPL